jgi:hypothetical protein
MPTPTAAPPEITTLSTMPPLPPIQPADQGPLTPAINNAGADDTESAQRIAAAHPLVARNGRCDFSEPLSVECARLKSGWKEKGTRLVVSLQNPTTNLSKENVHNFFCTVLKLRPVCYQRQVFIDTRH